MIPFTGCPHCKGIRFAAGPRGGSSQNVTCLGCGAGFNLLIPPLPGPFLLLHEISAPGSADDRAQLVHYIIEMVPENPYPPEARINLAHQLLKSLGIEIDNHGRLIARERE